VVGTGSVLTGKQEPADSTVSVNKMPNPLKALFIVENPTRNGGAYYRGLNLGVSLARRGHDVTLMTIHPTERWRVIERELDGVKLVETPDMLWAIGRTGWDPWDTLQRTRWIRRHKFEVIHTVKTRSAVSLSAILGRKAAGSAAGLVRPQGGTSERDGWPVHTLIGPLEQLFEEKLAGMPMGRSSTLMRSAVAPKRWTFVRAGWHEPHARRTHCRQIQSFYRTTMPARNAGDREA